MTDIPDELLCEVFVLLPFVDRVKATHVCRSWRNACLDRPATLWSRIEYEGERIGVVRQLLERAKDVPVDVKILLTDDTFEDTMTSIMLHLHHIRRLVLYAGNTGELDLSMGHIHCVYASLAYPAPILEALEIDLDMDELNQLDLDPDDDYALELMEMLLVFDYHIPTNLFAAHAPCLMTATWKTMRLHPNGIPALTGLTRFSFYCTLLLESQLVTIVTCLPCLKALRIDAMDGYEPRTTLRPPSFRLEGLDIQMMALIVLRRQSLLPLLEYFDYLQIPHVTTFGYSDWLEHFIASPRGLPQTLRIEEQRSDLDDWDMQTDSGYSSRCDGLKNPDVMALPVTRHIFEQLDALVMPMRVIIDSEYLPPLHNLARLSILCRYGYDIHRLSGRPPRLVCPNLRRLEFCGPRPPMKQLDLTAENLELVMESIFPAGGQRWSHISLQHVTLDKATATEPGRTHRILDTVTIANDPLPLSLTRERQLKWHV